MLFKKAFTLLELVFVVLIIGILSQMALPTLSQYKDDAKFLKLKMEYALLSSALALMRNEARLKKLPSYPSKLDSALLNQEGQALFYCENCPYSLLSSPIISSKKGWMKSAEKRYRFFLNAKKVVDFSYDDARGILNCEHATLCKELL